MNFPEDIRSFHKEKFCDLTDLTDEKWGHDLLDQCLIFMIQLFLPLLLINQACKKKNYPVSSFLKVWEAEFLEDYSIIT